jgi:hypothetical protein
VVQAATLLGTTFSTPLEWRESRHVKWYGSSAKPKKKEEERPTRRQSGSSRID